MARKRIESRHGTAKAGPVVADGELQRLAVALARIAAMDALPLAPSPPRRRKRRCAT